MAKGLRSKSKRKFRAIKRDAVFGPVESARAARVAKRMANPASSSSDTSTIPLTYEDGRPRPFNFLDFMKTGSRPELISKIGDRVERARRREEGRRGRSEDVKDIGGLREIDLEEEDVIDLEDEATNAQEGVKIEEGTSDVKMEQDSGASLARLRRQNPSLYLSRNQLSRVRRGKSKVRLPGVKTVNLGKKVMARRGMERSW
ncbi:hypothetical protein M427DRAFT_56043 [Gonapodya prolifera JEL478]|uniref:DUF2423 domain-containing protein n=1 Tax=Gonapodya prolifera (strain JEL478) TaxID=1344416 RepID=A0A139AHY2_GONPJ|nr:hypothetical protein M427DRAFT_56043 [Gonapodya prolifera JEL478]|eukprot:KXS16154.1 hypothetical protein M427DRAFT_56043 [Gonapodya prolifera JEL478]